jgi:hypothetical protein
VDGHANEIEIDDENENDIGVAREQPVAVAAPAVGINEGLVDEQPGQDPALLELGRVVDQLDAARFPHGRDAEDAEAAGEVENEGPANMEVAQVAPAPDAGDPVRNHGAIRCFVSVFECFLLYNLF